MDNQTSCPITNLSNAFKPLDLTDPYPVMAQARREEPVFYSPEIDYWVVTRFEDIRAVFQDFETFTAENTITPIEPFSETVLEMLNDGDYTPVPVLSNNVPPSHTRIRRLVSRLFTPRRMKHFEPEIRELVNGRIDSFINLGKVDIVSAMTYELPAMVLFRVLGVPDEDVAQVKIWSDNRILLYYGRPTPEEQIEFTKNLIPFWKYTVGLVEKKVAQPEDDLISDLIAMRNGDDAILTINEIASCMITLLVAGHETTTAQMSNTIQHLLEDRPKWDALCQNPALIPNANEELMRFDPSVCTWRRVARKACTIAGVDIPKDSNLLLMLNSGNRDTAVFPEPDEIVLDRKNAARNLAFGLGIHYCVGAPLARLELNITLEELTRRTPTLRLVPNQIYEYVENLSFRGPLKLWVEWTT